MALFNDKSKKDFRRALRREATYAERALWNSLRRNGVGAKFRRQESIGDYVVDFYCPELLLAIEVDGASHAGREEYDKMRDDKLSLLNIITLRFTDAEVLYSSDHAVVKIRERVEQLREDGRSVRRPSSQSSIDDKLHQALRGQPPPNPRLEKAGELGSMRLFKAGKHDTQRLEEAVELGSGLIETAVKEDGSRFETSE